MFFLHINNTHTKDNEMQNETGYLYDEFGRIIEKHILKITHLYLLKIHMINMAMFLLQL